MTQSDHNVCPRCGQRPCWANERTLDEVRRAIDADKAKLARLYS